jgi:hypothetical protein
MKLLEITGQNYGHDNLILNFNNNNNDHNENLGLKTCSFTAQCVLGLSIFVLVFPHPVVPEVGTGKPTSTGGFCIFVPGGLNISFDTVLCILLCCSLLICYAYQRFCEGPIL